MFLFCVRFADVKVNDRSEEKAKARTKNAPMHASLFLLTTDGYLEKGVEGGVHMYLHCLGKE